MAVSKEQRIGVLKAGIARTERGMEELAFALECANKAGDKGWVVELRTAIQSNETAKKSYEEQIAAVESETETKE